MKFHFDNTFSVPASQNNGVLTIRKLKMTFLHNKIENYVYEISVSCQGTHVCTIWPQSEKLSHDFDRNIGHVAQYPRKFIHDISFL